MAESKKKPPPGPLRYAHAARRHLVLWSVSGLRRYCTRSRTTFYASRPRVKESQCTHSPQPPPRASQRDTPQSSGTATSFRRWAQLRACRSDRAPPPLCAADATGGRRGWWRRYSGAQLSHATAVCEGGRSKGICSLYHFSAAFLFFIFADASRRMSCLD